MIFLLFHCAALKSGAIIILYIHPKKPEIYLMEPTTQQVSFTIEAPYFTWGEKSEKTQNIWIVCHGFGQLARHFMKRFDVLDPETNYVIAPQGLSRFYMDNYTKVAASWTTREFRDMHVDNQIAYLDQIYSREITPELLAQAKFNLLGFSQGVSVVTRWTAYRQIPIDRLILWAGGFPPELTPEKWTFLKSDMELWVVVGKDDEFLTDDRKKKQEELITNSIKKPEVIIFDGKHEVKREALKAFVDRL